MATTIEISEELRDELVDRKLFPDETYGEVILGLLEDAKELSGEAKRQIEKAREQIRAGDVSTLEELRRESGI